MAPSDQADSELQIRLTAETAAATEGVGEAARDIAGALQGVAPAAEQAAQAAAGAMEKVAQKSRQAAEEVKKVGEHAKMSAGQLRMVAVGMAGMAIGAWSSWDRANGGTHSETIDYAKGALGGAAQFSAMGAMFGAKDPRSLGILALIGAGAGAGMTYLDKKAAEQEEQKAREEAIASMREQVELYESLRARTEAFQKTLAGLGDTEADATSRTAAREREIARREAEDARLATAQREAASRNDADAFRSLSRDRQINAQELAALKNLRIEAPAPERRERTAFDPSDGDSFLKKGFDLFGGLGGGVNDAATQLAREGNAIARQQLSVLDRIASRRTVATWGP